jgi:hypothetical protein
MGADQIGRPIWDFGLIHTLMTAAEEGAATYMAAGQFKEADLWASVAMHLRNAISALIELQNLRKE